ncbi:hypothetical protein BDP55DRAFT_630703 [Colletotrichum godetiae]|uniref:Zn(2)-C6 fungal-type domain-containing protein n=1 Tax=Colletotrichum godetiae TaxID=1209918 RepID=A0AAJ0ARB9_9PEZI|nr:uncharacterized protein BDP55DRAFT_630703 [Colletotrichum godetiae]KAK1687511.1 hypothetical protein BDP55DRAFT_630703 [Colletotrichum godetiae]
MAPSPRAPNPSQTPCLVCRHRKVRCDRIKPECGFCSKGGLQCEYSTARKTPGLRAGYVENLEKRLDCLEREFQAFKGNIDPHGSRYLMAGAGAETVSRLSALPRATGLSSQLSISNGPVLGSSVAATSPSCSINGRSQDKVTEACNLWFQKHHSWFPILHEPTMMEACQKYSGQHETPVTVALEAITAVVTSTDRGAAHGDDTERSGEQGRRRLLEDQILLHAIHHLSLHTLQALLILAIVEYGSGRMVEFYNLISLCKRTSTQLGLRDLVAHNCMNYGFPSVIPSRMLALPATAVEQEEKIRAFWTIEALDSASTVGSAWHLSVSQPLPTASLPCDEEIWRCPESIFLQQPCDTTSVSDLQQRKLDCTILSERLMAWHRDFEQMLTVRTPPYTDLFDGAAAASHHPNTILIHCTVHSAVVSLHQRLIFPDDDTGSEHSWKDAAERCLNSCDEMIKVIRGAGDDMLETANPHIIHCVFVAARFNIIYDRVLGLGPPNKVWLLIYGLRICGQRWPLARQLLKVLEAAAGTEGYGGVGGLKALPGEFWDLQYLSLDIYEALRVWAIET